MRLWIFGVLVLFVAAIASAQTLSTSDCPPTMPRAECEQSVAEYNKLQEEIAAWERVLADTRQKKNTLQGDVTYLNAQIKEAETQIRAKNIAINRLSKDIEAKTETIKTLEFRIDKGRESLASFLRRQAQVDDLSLAELAFSSGDLGELFQDVDRMRQIQEGLKVAFEEIRGVKRLTETERQLLAAKQDQELDAKYVVETKKQEIDRNKQQKDQLLAITANQETTYQQVLSARQAEAAQIRARLFPLRDTEGIQFGDAVRYAQQASAKTGVRAAFILAILSQESDLGKNVGNCLVTDLATGNGKGKNTGTPFTGVMKAPRDTVPFERITKALGKDWSTTPVSCPQPGGYGGAMGPTQFIPSTWETIEGELKQKLGLPATNPWNAEHAIMATGIYLARVGGAAGGYSAEHRAAAQYYAGSGWATRGQGYANSVMGKATAFQRDIDFLADN